MTFSTSRTATVTPAFFMAAVDALRLSMISLSSSLRAGVSPCAPGRPMGRGVPALEGLELALDQCESRPQPVEPLLGPLALEHPGAGA